MGVFESKPILIVDDVNTMIRVLRNLLRQLGFTQIDEACDGATALAKMRVKDYALVISDTHMAPMSGLELMAAARADARTSATPFIILGDEDQSATRAGAAASLIAPFSAQMLRAKLEPVLGAI
ncbi:MAG: response regulator [Terricaulis sp.]|nr:response regulator [Terricaulis sp.]